MDTQLTPLSLPSLRPMPQPGRVSRRGGSGPCWKSPRKERHGITSRGSQSQSIATSNSHHLTAVKRLCSFLRKVSHPCFLLFSHSPQGQRNHNADSQWKKSQTASLSCLSFPTPKTHQLPPHDQRSWTAALKENPGAGRGLFPAVSGSPQGRDVTAQSALPARPRLCTS